MKIWKKNMIALAILVTVCGGIFANWRYNQNQVPVDLAQTLNEDKLLSADTLVMGGEQSATYDSVSVMADYFAAVRLSRQEARDSAVSLIQETMAYSDASDSEASSAQLEEIVQTALCEAQIESMVIAKGYADCVAYIGEEGVSVAVASPDGGLQQADVAVIADIVLTQSDYEMEDIRVVEVQ